MKREKGTAVNGKAKRNAVGVTEIHLNDSRGHYKNMTVLSHEKRQMFQYIRRA